MWASENGHVEAVRLLLDRGAVVNAKNYVSTCGCTDVSVSVCLCLVLCCVVGMYAIIVNYNMYFRSAIIAIVLIPVMVGWGDRVDGLLL